MSGEASKSIPTKVLWEGGRSPFSVSYGKMMMWFFLISDALTFGGLLVSLGFAKHRYETDAMVGEIAWPVSENVFWHFPFTHAFLPLMYVALMTFILIVSSVTMVLAVEAGHRMDRKAVTRWMAWTVVGGAIFLGSQVWEWSSFIKGSDYGAYRMADGRMATLINMNDDHGHGGGHEAAAPALAEGEEHAHDGEHHGDAHANHGDSHANHGDEHASHGDAHAEHGDAHTGHGDDHADHSDDHAESHAQHDNESGHYGNDHGHDHGDAHGHEEAVDWENPLEIPNQEKYAWALVLERTDTIKEAELVAEVMHTNEHVRGASLSRNEYGHTLYANFFFFITGFHGTHVLSGVILNFIILLGVLKGTYHNRGHYEMVEKVGLYWHFVDLVWVFVFTFFYLI